MRLLGSTSSHTALHPFPCAVPVAGSHTGAYPLQKSGSVITAGNSLKSSDVDVSSSFTTAQLNYVPAILDAVRCRSLESSASFCLSPNLNHCNRQNLHSRSGLCIPLGRMWVHVNRKAVRLSLSRGRKPGNPLKIHHRSHQSRSRSKIIRLPMVNNIHRCASDAVSVRCVQAILSAV